MSKKQIAGLTVEIGGDTTKLGKALGDIDRRSSSLSKELGEINKLLKLDPGNAELLAQKQKVLQDAIKSTGDRLALLKKAHEEAAEAASSGNAEAEETLRALEREIIATEQKLGSYESAAKETEDAMNGLGAGAKNAAESSGELAKSSDDAAEDLEKQQKAAQDARKELADLAEKGADKAAKALTALATAALAVVAGVGKLVLGEAETADELTDLAGKTGLTAEQLQKYQYAATMCGTTLETLTGAQTKLVKNMSTAQKGTGDAADAFRKLGVRITDASGTLRKSDDVFNDALNALGKVGNETERDALAMQIFGKSARELNPLIKAGEDALKRYGQEAENVGAVVSEEAVSALTDLNTEVKQTKAQFSALKTETAAEFAPVMIELFHNLQQLITGAKTELKKPEIRNAIKKLGTAVSELLAKGVNTALKLLPKLARAAEFLVSNLKPLVITLGSLWAIFKTVSIVTKAIDAFKTLKAAMVALKTATTTATAAQEGMNTAMAAGSTVSAGWTGAILAVVAALAALGLAATKESRAMAKEFKDAADEIGSNVTTISNSLKTAREEYEKATGANHNAAEQARTYIDRLEQLEGQGKLTSDEQREYNDLITRLRYIMPGLNLELDKQTGLLKSGAAALRESVDVLEHDYDRESAQAYYKELLDDVYKFEREYKKAQDKWAEAQRKYAYATSGSRLLRNQTADSVMGGNFSAFLDFFTYGADVADKVGGELQRAGDAYRDAQAAADEFFETHKDQLGEVAEATEDVTESTDEVASAYHGLAAELEAAGAEADEAAQTHFATLKAAAQNMFEAINTGNKYSMAELTKNLRQNREAVEKWHGNLKKIYERGASDEFVKYLENLGLGYAEAVDTIANSTDEELDTLISEWEQSESSAYGMGQDWGKQVYNGITAGMRSKRNEVLAELHSLVWRMKQAMQIDLDMHSPSRVFRGMGRNTFKGYGLGLQDEEPNIISQLRSANDSIRDTFNPGLTAALPDPTIFDRHPAFMPVTDPGASAGSSALGVKLDKILAAIEAGQMLVIDGDKLVGATAEIMDNALGRSAILAGRGVK